MNEHPAYSRGYALAKAIEELEYEALELSEVADVIDTRTETNLAEEG